LAGSRSKVSLMKETSVDKRSIRMSMEVPCGFLMRLIRICHKGYMNQFL